MHVLILVNKMGPSQYFCFVFTPDVTSIYVVNHPLDKEHDTVEKFTWDGNTKVLTHVRTILDPSFRLWVNFHNAMKHIDVWWYIISMA